MPVVDADAHVDETEDTWEYIDEPLKRFKPMTVSQNVSGPIAGIAKGYTRYWFIDGRFWLRRVRDDVRTATTVEKRELHDIPGRLAHMDELGIDYQVVYPTLFLMSPTGKPEVELALTKSYNRWMAAKSKESGGRIRYVAMMPLLSMDEAVKEVEFAKENGACGISKKGVETGGRIASDPYFFPLYKAAEAADLPICFHVGNGNPEMSDSDFTALSPWHFGLSAIDAFLSLTLNEVPDKFPNARWGFIECMSSWLPYVMSDLRARDERTQWQQPFTMKSDVVRDCKYYITCQTMEDLPMVIEYAGEDNLMAGTDYTHADQSAEIQTLDIFKQMGEKGMITKEQARKIREDNPAKFYGLS